MIEVPQLVRLEEASCYWESYGLVRCLDELFHNG
jgi:hypothetical protein